GLEVEEAPQVGLREAVRTRGQQLHEHAVLRDVERARRREAALERAVGEVERDEEGGVERQVLAAVFHSAPPPSRILSSLKRYSTAREGGSPKTHARAIGRYRSLRLA